MAQLVLRPHPVRVGLVTAEELDHQHVLTGRGSAPSLEPQDGLQPFGQVGGVQHPTEDRGLLGCAGEDPMRCLRVVPLTTVLHDVQEQDSPIEPKPGIVHTKVEVHEAAVTGSQLSGHVTGRQQGLSEGDLSNDQQQRQDSAQPAGQPASGTSSRSGPCSRPSNSPMSAASSLRTITTRS